MLKFLKFIPCSKFTEKKNLLIAPELQIVPKHLVSWPEPENGAGWLDLAKHGGLLPRFDERGTQERLQGKARDLLQGPSGIWFRSQSAQSFLLSQCCPHSSTRGSRYGVKLVKTPGCDEKSCL